MLRKWFLKPLLKGWGNLFRPGTGSFRGLVEPKLLLSRSQMNLVSWSPFTYDLVSTGRGRRPTLVILYRCAEVPFYRFPTVSPGPFSGPIPARPSSVSEQLPSRFRSIRKTSSTVNPTRNFLPLLTQAKDPP